MTTKLKMEQAPLTDAVAKLKEICPSAVTSEGKVDIEQLKTFFGTEVTEDTFEKYEFTWVGKNAAKIEANRPIRKTLRPVVEDSKNWDTTKNLYIEGDNLDALKLLQESYLGKVKMIYIDPPYNTGNDFVYCDEFAIGCEEYLEKKGACDADGNRLFVNTETNGRFHSDWCSMMYPRLKLARDLLSDDGVIFISIDDREISNLRKICDEIFGAYNFVAQCARKAKTVTNDSKFGLNSQHDYCVLYAKAISNIKLFGNKKTFSNYTNPDNDPKGAWTSADPVANRGGAKPFDIVNPITGQVDKPRNNTTWCFNYESFCRYVKEGRIKFKEKVNENGRGFIFKRYKNEIADLYSPVDSLFAAGSDFLNQKGTRELADLLGNNIFDFPKPVDYVHKLVQIALTTDNNAIVLDFFSGSATTAQAVMQLNAEDGGNRRFIMVQLPEKCDEDSETFKAGYKNICEIGKERIRRAGDKIVAETGKTDLDIGFRVLRVDSTNMEDVYYKPSDTTQTNLLEAVDNIKTDRSDMDLLFGVLVDCGLRLDMPIETKKTDGKTYYVVNNGDLVACFEQNVSDKLIYEIANMKPTCAVFRDSSFGDAKDKINVSEIFKNITGSDECVKVL